MPEGFSAATAGPKPRIAPTTPLAQASPERKELYEPLAAWKDGQDSPADAPPSVPPLPPETPAPEDAHSAPSEEDKRAFLAALLGGKRYEKRYALFGSLAATFADRTTEETERLYTQLSLDEKEGLVKSDEDLAVRLERYQLALQLRALDGLKPPARYAELELNAEFGKELATRLDALLKHPKPLYQALMEACRTFERHVGLLTERALDTPFWKAGGGD
jgi:hypothetical protein